MFKFLHAADLHLDSPCKGLEQYEGAPVDTFRGATRRALENLVDLAIEERVAFVIIAGDLFDGDWTDYGTGLYLNAQLAKLRDAGIKVFSIRGNHDAASLMTKSLRFPDNVFELGHERPQSVPLDHFGVMVHGQGYATRAMVKNIAVDYPAGEPGRMNIGILHTCASGRDGHEAYAPCSLDDMRSKGYDYWALGHVHQREVLDRSPWIVFPGNIQGRHAREVGAKGCTLVTVERGAVTRVEHRSLDVMRWAVCRVDAAGAADDEEVLGRIAEGLGSELSASDGRLLALRLEIRGACDAHDQIAARPDSWSAQVRDLARDVGSGRIWVEKIRLRTEPPARLRSDDGPLGELLEVLEQLRNDETSLRALALELKDLKNRLPAELREGDDALDLDSPEHLRDLVEDLGPMLLRELA